MDELMFVLVMFCFKVFSLFVFDKEWVEGNLHIIYGIECVLCDTYMRDMFYLVSFKWLCLVFKSVFR